VSPDITPALRVAGRGLLAAGALAAGAALGAVAERSLLRASGQPLPDGEGSGFGDLRGEVHHVAANDGMILHVEVDELDAPSADGLTIVFVHGYALNLDSWHFQRQALRGRARLVFYDQRSHGRSQKADFDSHHIDQLGHDLESVIAAVAPSGPLMLVGHSMGGMTIMALAVQRPDLFADRIFGVGLLSTTAGGLAEGGLGLPSGVGRAFHRVAPALAASLVKRKQLIEWSNWSASDLGLLLTRLYSFGSTATDEASRFVASMVASTPIEVVSEFLPALQEHDKRAALSVFQGVEVLVLVGATDRLTPREYSDYIVSQVPGAEYVVVEDSGHMVTLEKHEVVDTALLDLLDRVRRDIAAETASSA
jgi:pimeloyl-ACP methyl ester carboxylesterase